MIWCDKIRVSKKIIDGEEGGEEIQDSKGRGNEYTRILEQSGGREKVEISTLLYFLFL
jgi:hypothetical protein